MASRRLFKQLIAAIAATIVFMSFVLITKEANLFTYRLPQQIQPIEYLASGIFVFLLIFGGVLIYQQIPSQQNPVLLLFRVFNGIRRIFFVKHSKDN